MTSRERQLEEMLGAMLLVVERHQRRAAGTIHDLKEVDPRIHVLIARVRRELGRTVN